MFVESGNFKGEISPICEDKEHLYKERGLDVVAKSINFTIPAL